MNVLNQQQRQSSFSSGAAASRDDFVIYQDRGLAKGAKLVHGVNPVLLVEKITREKIQDCVYWKLRCFGINALAFIERAASLHLVAGPNSAGQPSHFQCLVLKLLQIQPAPEVITEFLEQKYFKYLTCIALFYVRLCYGSRDVYTTLEPFLGDYRKIRFRENGAAPVLEYHVDEFVDALLTKERVCDLILPRLANRMVLEDNGELEPRRSLLDEEGDSEGSSSGEIDEEEQ